MDDNVHQGYAALLLPRAIGYSAGLLNYFFRGTLEITAPDRCLYSLIDGSFTPQEFTKIKAKVRNTTTIKDQAGNNIGPEEIQSGTLQAVARYKKRTNYQPDLTTDPPTADSREADFSYSVSEPIVISALSGTTPQEFTFDFTNSRILAGITDLYLQVVFKGTLGNEADNAIAVGFKDLSEPTHINAWNTSDQMYINGQVIPASPEALKATINEKIAFCPPDPVIAYDVEYNSMAPGAFGRIITITDVGVPVPYFITDIEISDPIFPTSSRSYSYSGAVNQEVNGVFIPTAEVSAFRWKRFHAGSGYFKYSPSDGGFWTATWPAGVNPDAIHATVNW